MSRLEEVVSMIRKDIDAAICVVQPDNKRFWWENITNLKGFPNWVIVPTNGNLNNRTFGGNYDAQLSFIIYYNVKDNEADRGYNKSMGLIGDFIDALGVMDTRVEYVFTNILLNQRFSRSMPSLLTSAVQIDCMIDFNICK
jgi:hypothetical protein